MWWRAVPDDHLVTGHCFPFGFAFEQELYSPVERFNLRAVFGDDVGELIDCADQMGELFFKILHGFLIASF